MDKTKQKDFVEILYTGYSNGDVFDSNIEADLKKINPQAKAEKTIVIIGEKMVVSGLDKSLEGKEFNKEYEISLKPEEAFGPRRRELVKTIPLKAFHEQKISPQPGMVFAMDNALARIVAVSGARVMTDFNNPLSGKPVTYKYKIVRKVEDDKEKCEVVFKVLFRTVPEFEVKDKVVVKGPKTMELFVTALKEKFKEMIGKELAFELKEEKKAEKAVEKKN